MAKKKSADEVDVLELDYQPAELPSSQHRAGLAGLVLMVQWLERQGTNKGICEITRLDEHGATLRIDKQGLEALFDEVYAASKEEAPRDKLRKKKKTKEVIPPVKEEIRKELDPRTGKEKEKKVYIYYDTLPKGEFLLDKDPTVSGNNGIWIKLWRDVIWTIFRKKPTTRTPYNKRSDGKYSKDAEEAWQTLLKPASHTEELASTYFVGARAKNAENVPFKDRARCQFLLHFLPYAIQIYVPQIVTNDGELRFDGYALAIPDVANIKWFCEELPNILNSRSEKRSLFRPRDSVIDLVAESALDVFRLLQERITVREGELTTSDLVLGVDVIHVDEMDEDVRIKGTFRVTPETQMIDEYARLRSNLWNPLFKRQRLLNLVNHRAWYAGFDSLLSRLPYKELFAEQAVGFKHFRHDVKQSFENETYKEANDQMSEEMSGGAAIRWEALIYKMVGAYINRKLRSKYSLEWEQVKNNPSKKKEYEEMREKIAKDAFLAVRSRTEMDFINYFASTICSVSQYMDEESFSTLAQALYQETDKVRTLTMLALSARS